MKSSINTEQEIDHLRQFFFATTKKYIKQLEESRDNITDIFPDDRSDVAGLFAAIDALDGKLNTLLRKYPEVAEGLLSWFFLLLWRASSAVKPTKAIDARQDLIFSLMAAYAPDKDAMDGAVELLRKHLSLLERAQQSRSHADYQSLFHQCLMAYRVDVFEEVADAVLQIGAENLVEVQLAATKEFMGYWNNRK